MTYHETVDSRLLCNVSIYVGGCTLSHRISQRFSHVCESEIKFNLKKLIRNHIYINVRCPPSLDTVESEKLVVEWLALMWFSVRSLNILIEVLLYFLQFIQQVLGQLNQREVFTHYNKWWRQNFLRDAAKSLRPSTAASNSSIHYINCIDGFSLVVDLLKSWIYTKLHRWRPGRNLRFFCIIWLLEGNTVTENVNIRMTILAGIFVKLAHAISFK
jgi:hypothetical protein